MKQTAFNEDNVTVRTSLFGLIRRLWPYFMRQKLLFASVWLSIIAMSLAGRLVPTIFGHAIDEGIGKGKADVLLFAACSYLVLELAKGVFMFMHTYLFAKLGNRMLSEIRDHLLEHTLSLPMPFFDRNPTGRIVTRVTNDVVALGELFTQGIIHMFANLISMASIIAAMYLISPRLATVTLLIAPPVIWVALVLSAKIRVLLRESKKRLAGINAFVAENINGMRVLQLYRRIERNSLRFAELSSEYRAIQLRQVRLYALLWPTVNFFNAASVGVALWYGGKLTAGDAISTGAMIAFILHVRDFIHPLRTILEKYQLFQNSLSGAERIFTLLNETPETNSGAVLPLRRLAGRVDYRAVSFRYGANLPKVLEQIDLPIEQGQSVALVGRTGSGKSTMIALLQRFYDCHEGEILIDGLPITAIKRSELRRRIGVVQQDTFMFRGTIAENIGLGDPGISRAKIEEAARQACCADMLRRQPLGLDTRVEERGANLSFGERQLIAFARILAFDPDILILDEATANIDSQTEILIQAATRHVTKGRTSIIIAHRISTVLECDRIVVLDQGRIVEVGAHGDLMARRGSYYRLCQAQFRDSEDTLHEKEHEGETRA